MSQPDLPPVYDDLTFLSPLSDDRAAALVRRGALVERRQMGAMEVG
ncbi:hypothetical protein [Arsenicicoccus bolidensis]|uniref:Uncharacterized protein n=1 Tax=Arsenicicoccus bolidensis TaxID=229480 RepID=A0ABS9Q680_9MICO|nr:hypothetical protein [Arsenicicoccus bolidensis]MCG7323387.1 hypothetical protein [Arsenicicoccus bolidensis]